MKDSPPSPSVARILDANLNRAREALRVMEEYARFHLEDAGLAAALKGFRHRLTASLPPVWVRSLLLSRDASGDVGGALRTKDESRRDRPADAAAASAKRLQEALRAAAEYAKIGDHVFAEALERFRYESYDLERRLLLTHQARERFGGARLYVLLTESLCRGEWFTTAREALAGGADVLQLREKRLSDAVLLDRAARLVDLCREHHAWLMVNDRADVAAAAGAHGVHLGQGDLPVAAARRLLGAEAVIGVSTHTVEQAALAAATSPDYLAVGPMFPSDTKPQARVAGPSTLRDVRALTSLPLAAIGGIQEANAREVLAAAACCLCVCRGVIAQENVAAAARRLRAMADEAFARPPAAST